MPFTQFFRALGLRSRGTRPGKLFISCLALLSLTAGAEEKRITIPLALPFQTAASQAQSSAAAISAPAAQAPGSQASASSVASGGLTGLPLAPAGNAQAKDPMPGALKAPAANAAKSAAPTAKAGAQPSAKPASLAKAEATESKVIRPTPQIPLITTAQVRAPRLPDGNPESFVTHFEDYVATKIAPYVPGVAVVIVSDGQIKSLRAFGVKKRGSREMVTPDTVFRLASVSKTIASTAAAVMVDSGQLNWDTTVVSQLPQVQFSAPKYGNQITLKNLLSQSSGLPTHTYTPYIENNMAYAEAVRRLRFVKFVCPPGKCYAYQNVVYSLAGDMIGKKYGQPFESYVEDKLFDPLGMRTASYGLDGYRASPNRATPHIAQGKRWVPTDVTENYYHVPPAAGANASIVDMSRFLLAQLGRRPDVLPPVALNALQARVTKNSPAQNHYGTRRGVSNTAYGLGWRVFDYGRYKNFVHHGGWVKGFRSEMVFNRDLGIGMVFLTNSETRLARNVIFKFMDYYEMSQDAAQKGKK